LNWDEGSYTLSHTKAMAFSQTYFLPRRMSIVARTGRRTEQASSAERFWQRPKRQGKNVWLC